MAKKTSKKIPGSGEPQAVLDNILTSVDSGSFDPVDLHGENHTSPYEEHEEDLTGIQQDQDLSFALPRTQSEQEALLWGMMSVSLAAFARTCLRGPAEEPYNGQFLVAEHHEEWSDLVAEHRRLCILAPRDHGKCQRKGALILRGDGQRVPIEQWNGGEVLAFNPKTYTLQKTYAPPSRPNGNKRVLKIRTRTGRTVEVTENHPLYRWDGWQRADALRVGDRIAAPRTISGLGSDHVADAWLIGLLIGDGGLRGSNVTLTTNDPAILQTLRDGGYSLSEPDAAGQSYRIHGLQPRMRELGLMGKDAHEKRVPAALFTSTDSTIAEFISGYLDSDAHVSMHAGGSVEFYSVSEALLRDVQHLLMRLGVVAVLQPKLGKYKGEDHHSWRLVVRGDAICKLADVAHPRGTRAEKLAALSALQSKKKPAGTIDLLPSEFLPGHPYDLTRAVARRNGLQLQADAEILWDEIASITDMGVQETWSMHVPGLVNYVADDIVNHNTFFMDFAYPIWMAWKNPGKCGFIFSATQAQASRILRDIREEIETNPKLAFLMPAKATRWNDHEIRLANGHTIYARGFGTKVRGAHPVWIVCDDVLNDETAYSETVRKKQNDYFFNAVSNMLVPGGQLIVVGTPFHSQDLYAEVRERKAYRYCRYSAIKEDGTPLWRERYSLKLLKWKRDEDIGPLRFSREFQCEPIADDISLFPSYFFKGPVELPNVRLGMPRKFWTSLGVTIYMGVDFAISASTQADYTVIWVMGIDHRGNRWIIDIWKAKGVPYRIQKSKMVEFGRRYKPALIFLESNQMQRIFGDELLADTDLPIKKFNTTGLEKHSLEKGLPSIRTLLEAQKFKIPRGDERSVQLTNEWIAEMGGFIFDGGKVQSVGKHDDMAMACWICDQAIRAGAAFSMSWTSHDVFSHEEIEAIRKGDWSPTLDELLEEQVELGAQPTPDDPVPDSFQGSMQIVASGNPADDLEEEDDPEDEESDPWTGLPLPKVKRRRGQKGAQPVEDWRPQESIPDLSGGGWGQF